MTPQTNGQVRHHGHGSVNGPADDPLANERIVERHATGPARACLSRMPGNWYVRFWPGSVR